MRKEKTSNELPRSKRTKFITSDKTKHGAIVQVHNEYINVKHNK